MQCSTNLLKWITIIMFTLPVIPSKAQDSLLIEKTGQLIQQMNTVQWQLRQIRQKMNNQTQVLSQYNDSLFHRLQSNNSEIKQLQNTAFEAQQNQLKKVAQNIHENNRREKQAFKWHYILHGLSILLIVLLMIVLIYYRRKSVHFVAHKAEKMFENQSDISKKTDQLLKLNEEIEGEIYKQQKALKNQGNAASKIARDTVKKMIKKKYRKKQ